jgi:hypothetical protein
VPTGNENSSPTLNPGSIAEFVFVSDQDLVLDAVQEAQRILAEYAEAGPRRNPDETINMLLYLLGRRDVAAAVSRLRARHGLHVVK